MVTEDYISIETAKLLKEKGFDGDLFEYGNPDNPICTLQTAVKWIRKKHNIEIIIDVCKVGEEHKTMYAWTPVVVTENYLEYPISQTDGTVFGGLCDEHEQAVEKGILYCLNKLI